MDHEARARELFRSGYNCAQSVFVAFTDVTGLDEKTSARISSAFGGGMGRLREVCGALTASFMVLGITCGYDIPGDDVGKSALYHKVQELAREFEGKYGTLLCRDLLKLQEAHSTPDPTPRTDEFYKTRPCEGIIAGTAAMLEDFLKRAGIGK